MATLVLTEQDADLDVAGFIKTLRRAAELVDQGFCQFDMAQGGGYCLPYHHPNATQFCEMGAFLRARLELGLPELDNLSLCLLLRLAGYSDVSPVTGEIFYNFGGMYADAPGRTGDEVAAHLRQGADTLEHAWHPKES